ncbi:MAG: hypothetical protein ACXVEF_09895 [Polyangiales bacterium]
MRGLFALSLVLCVSCGGSPAAEVVAADSSVDVPVEVEDSAEDAVFVDTAMPDASCPDVDALVECLSTSGPDGCANACDTDEDGDGVGDRLELAIARTYAPAFAFNGGTYGGNAETDWAANANHFVTHSKVVYRDSSDHLVDAMPSLSTLEGATYGSHHGNDPASGEGSDFWLCMTDSSDAARVKSKAAMLALPDGVDLVSVVHPAGTGHLFVSYSLLFAYNEHTTVDNHEGDWEGIAVFVDRKTGAVYAAWFERHDTTDDTKFVDATVTKDPATETSYGDLDSGFDKVHGLRFWDAKKRHVVAYVATGSHAMYDYPANTHIVKFGPRDTHDGDGPKLLPFQGALVASFGDVSGDTIAVHPKNPGEASKITVSFARFRGQWGCDDGTIGKSWPGPFGNARHPRPLLERTWGSPPKP